MQNFSPPALLLARMLMSAIFIHAGFGKLMGYAAAQQYMASAGLPGALLPLVILTELGCGLLILVGWQTRIVAFLLAGFCVVTALAFHMKFGDRAQLVNFEKNMAMAGGFLALMIAGAGPWSLDRGKR